MLEKENSMEYKVRLTNEHGTVEFCRENEFAARIFIWHYIDYLKKDPLTGKLYMELTDDIPYILINKYGARHRHIPNPQWVCEPILQKFINKIFDEEMINYSEKEIEDLKAFDYSNFYIVLQKPRI